MKTGVLIRTAYGVDLAPDHIRLVRCRKGRRGCLYETVYDGPAPITGAAKDRLDEEGRRLDVMVVGALSPHIAFARWVHTPLNSIEKSLRVYPSLLDVQIPFAVEQCEVAAAQIRREENRAISILAVACRRDDIRQAVEEFGAAGISLDALEHEGLALWGQSFLERPETSAGARLVAFVRELAVTVAVGEDRADGFRAAQRFRMGRKDFLNTVRGPMICRDFAVKIRQMLLVHVPNRPDPSSLVWCWCGAADDATRRALETELRVVGPPHFVRHEQSDMFLARALATRAVLGENHFSNVLKGRLAPWKDKARIERMHRRLAGAMAAAGLSLWMLAAVLWWVPTWQNRRLEQQIAALARDLSGIARVPRGQELLVVRRMLSDRAIADDVVRRCAKDEVAQRLADWLKQCALIGVQLEWMSLQDDMLSARGTLKDWNDGDALTQWLENNLFVVNLSRRDAGPDGRVPFTLSASRPRLEAKP